jgi:hypothetical protein
MTRKATTTLTHTGASKRKGVALQRETKGESNS